MADLPTLEEIEDNLQHADDTSETAEGCSNVDGADKAEGN